MTRRRLAWMLALVACGPATRVPDGTAPSAAPAGAADTPASAPAPAPAACVDEPGMVYIAGGDYHHWRDRELRPIAAFWIDRTEVTVAAFRAFVAAGHDTPYRSDSKRFPLVCTWELPDNDQLPVNCIDWYQAEAFCLWSGKRLPTAQEWGWVAQGREELRKRPWGDELASCDLTVTDQNRDDDVTGCGRNAPWPVGSMPRDVTRDGVLDMGGNLGEATSTGFNDDEKSTRYYQGGTWRTLSPTRLTIAETTGSVIRAAYSDQGGVRCVKPAGPKPPCKPPP